MTTHENLREWMGANKVYFKDLARLVHVASLSYYLKAPGKLFPPEWIETWSKAYGWSDRETFLFQYERPYQEGALPKEERLLTNEELADLVARQLVAMELQERGVTWTV